MYSIRVEILVGIPKALGQGVAAGGGGDARRADVMGRRMGYRRATEARARSFIPFIILNRSYANWLAFRFLFCDMISCDRMKMLLTAHRIQSSKSSEPVRCPHKNTDTRVLTHGHACTVSRNSYRVCERRSTMIDVRRSPHVP